MRTFRPSADAANVATGRWPAKPLRRVVAVTVSFFAAWLLLGAQDVRVATVAANRDSPLLMSGHVLAVAGVAVMGWMWAVIAVFGSALPRVCKPAMAAVLAAMWVLLIAQWNARTHDRRVNAYVQTSARRFASQVDVADLKAFAETVFGEYLKPGQSTWPNRRPVADGRGGWRVAIEMREGGDLRMLPLPHSLLRAAGRRFEHTVALEVDATEQNGWPPFLLFKWGDHLRGASFLYVAQRDFDGLGVHAVRLARGVYLCP